MHNFDKTIDRRGTSCMKWDRADLCFGPEVADEALKLWVADMDFAIPESIDRALRQRLDHPVLGYTLRDEAWYQTCQAYIQRHYNWTVEKDWLVFSPGIVPALAHAVISYTQPGDGVLILSPVYGPFYQVVRQNDRQIVELPLLHDQDGYHIDYEGVERLAASGQVQLAIFCSPHNPVGRAFKPEELRRYAEILCHHRIPICSDEIHADFCYEQAHSCLPSLSPEIAANSLCCLAPSKTYNIAGIGQSVIIIPDRKLRETFIATQNRLHVSGHIFAYEAFKAAWTDCDDWLVELKAYLKEGRDRLMRYFDSEPLIEAHCPEATFLLWLDCRKLMQAFGFKSQKELTDFFALEAKVALSPGTDFGTEAGQGYLRFNFGSPHSVLDEAIRRMKNAIDARRPQN